MGVLFSESPLIIKNARSKRKQMILLLLSLIRRLTCLVSVNICLTALGSITTTIGVFPGQNANILPCFFRMEDSIFITAMAFGK